MSLCEARACKQVPLALAPSEDAAAHIKLKAQTDGAATALAPASGAPAVASSTSTCSSAQPQAAPSPAPAPAPLAAAAAAAAAPPRVIEISIYSDTVCPFCYVGLLRLQRACQRLDDSQVRVEIKWLPFFLDPELPKESVSKSERYIEKFGVEKSSEMQRNMTHIGLAEGIAFRFGGRIGSTIDSHRLSEFARQQGKQTQLVQRMFKAYFEEEQDISDLECLVRLGEESGLQGDLRQYLASEAGLDDVFELVESASDRGITGVPNFLVDSQFEVRGAQSVDYMLAAFSKIGLPLLPAAVHEASQPAAASAVSAVSAAPTASTVSAGAASGSGDSASATCLAAATTASNP